MEEDNVEAAATAHTPVTLMSAMFHTYMVRKEVCVSRKTSLKMLRLVKRLQIILTCLFLVWNPLMTLQKAAFTTIIRKQLLLTTIQPDVDRKYLANLLHPLSANKIPSFVLIYASWRASPLLEELEDDEMCKPKDIAFTGVHRQRRATGEGIAERRKLSKLEQGTAVAVDCTSMDTKTTTLVPSFQSSD